MVRIGVILLTILTSFNLLLASAILITILCFGKNPPILYVSLDQAEVAHWGEQTMATFKSLAVYFNSAIVTFCLLSLFVIWAGLNRGQLWAFWGLLISMGISQILGFFADSLIGNKTLVVNIILTAIFVLAMSLSWFGLKVN